MKGRRAAVLAVASAFVASCSLQIGGQKSAPPSTPGPSPSSPTPAGPVPSPLPSSGRTAAEAMKALCPKAEPYSGGTPAQAVAPPAITQVESEVEQVRQLRYLRDVGVEPITTAEMDRKLDAAFDDSYPAGYYRRRSAAWRTIGVIPPGSDIRSALRSFQQGQVVGFYNPENGELVYIGDENLGVNETFVLAHELTHALDDQHFGLKKIDRLQLSCRDEAIQASLGLVEGDAQLAAGQVVARFPPTGSDSGDFGGGPPSDVPRFIQELQFWPYDAGQAFVAALEARGGEQLVDQAFESYPVSTEQIMHPDRWPGDVPTPVDIPDEGPALGRRWGDLDVMEVGEQWLQTMLGLRLGDGEASDAAAGWDGGIYRAWSDGSNVAVDLRTVWDTGADAQEFRSALVDWTGESQLTEVLQASGTQVDAVFATDPVSLSKLAHALGV